MLADGDRVLVAVSGGIDSLVLAWVLLNWRKKAPIHYKIQAVHIDMQPGRDRPGAVACRVTEKIEGLDCSCEILPADRPVPLPDTLPEDSTRNSCFQCARSRRTQLFAYARRHGYGTIALGHHCDDIVETFFLNMTCSGNISTMRPAQQLFGGRLTLIRPLAYLRKDDISAIAQRIGLQDSGSDCPLSGQTRRREIRELLEQIYARIPGSREHIFAALGNVRSDYLLQPSGGSHADKS